MICDSGRIKWICNFRVNPTIFTSNIMDTYCSFFDASSCMVRSYKTPQKSKFMGPTRGPMLAPWTLISGTYPLGSQLRIWHTIIYFSKNLSHDISITWNMCGLYQAITHHKNWLICIHHRRYCSAVLYRPWNTHPSNIIQFVWLTAECLYRP